MRSMGAKDKTRIDLTKFYPARPQKSRKGDFGRIVIAGGSDRYSGCLALNALAALRAGADLAFIVAPRRAADIAASYSPDLITVPCSSNFPDPRIVRQLAINADALILGCGVERTRAAHDGIISIIHDSSIPMVADAEALHAIAEKPSVCSGKRILLTPNAGEFRVLASKSWPSSRRDRLAAVKTLAKRYAAAVLVKGAQDYVSDGVRVHIDHEGSPYLTKGGYGDLVAGVAGAFLARGHAPFDAAKAAVYFVGRAGQRASKKFREGTLASDALIELTHVSGN